MKILYIHQYFKTPKEAGSTRSYWLSKEFIRRGHQVTMVCHANTLRNNHQERLIRRENIDGIDVIWIRNAYSNSMGFFQRIWSFLKFLFVSSFVVLKERNIDIVFASSTPLTVAFPALIKRFIQGAPYIFEVRDLWPEAPIQLGFIKNPLFVRFLRWFERITYQKAEHVIALSPGMVEGVIKYIPEDKVSMVPNMAKTDQFWIRDKDPMINREFGLQDESFKLVYFGAFGVANGMDYMMDVIKILDATGHHGIEFVFVGEGVKKKALLEFSQRLSTMKVSVLDRQPMEVISSIVNNCDISVCTFSDIPILKTNSPNKLFDSLSAGKPSIVNSDGWTRSIVEEYNCGVYVDPKRPADMAEKVLDLKNNPERCKQMGNNARKLAEEHFDKGILCRQAANIIDNILCSRNNTN